MYGKNCFIADVIAYSKRVGCVSRDLFCKRVGTDFFKTMKIGNILATVTRTLDEGLSSL